MIRLTAVAVLVCAAVVAPARAEDPPKKLTADEVQKILTEWDDLTKAAIKAAGAGQFSEAERSFRDALVVAGRLDTAEDRVRYAVQANAWKNLGLCLRQQQKFAEAEEPYRKTLAALRRLHAQKNHQEIVHVLHVLGSVLQSLGRLVDAEEVHREGLEMVRRLHPHSPTAPRHPLIAAGSYELAIVLTQQGRPAEAAVLLREALDILGPKPPAALSDLHARCVGGLGNAFRHQSRAADAEPLLRECVKLNRASSPDGNPQLMAALANLATALVDQAKLTEAADLIEEAVRLGKRLYATPRFPRGHPQYAMLLNNVGILYQRQAKPEKAEATFREAMEVWDNLYPPREYPDGHAARGQARMMLANVLRIRERYKEAGEQARDGVATLRKLHPDDHPSVAVALQTLGSIQSDAGQYEDADRSLREAVAMFRRVYPRSAFPHGHPDLALALSRLARLQYRSGDRQARDTAREALGVAQGLVAQTAAESGEGAALTLAWGDLHLDLILSIAVESGALETAYPDVWTGKGVIARACEARLRATRAATDPKAAKLLAELGTARRRRAELLVAPATGAAERARREAELAALDKTISDRTRELGQLLPVGQTAESAKGTPADLQAALPAGAAVVDFMQYVSIRPNRTVPGKAGERLGEGYVAFVLTKDKFAAIDLGAAEPIALAVAAWRKALTDGREIAPEVPTKVRELVWDKVHEALPPGTSVVYVCPDQALCRVPFGALPGDKAGTVLLDQFSLVTVPHVPFLLDSLRRQDKHAARGAALVVGGVKYDAGPKSGGAPVTTGPLLASGQKLAWPFLSGAAAEADGVAAAAKRRKFTPTRLSGGDATASAVLAALPKAQVAHFATHGFFADPSFRSAFRLDEKDYQQSWLGERVGRAANSPLVMTGLVFAGANDPETPGRGIVTGEQLVDLDLSRLELAVLSACETGLGDVAGGEGVFGLQRAFHLAGTRDVVASLWKVPDAATAALMGEFYRGLWEKELPPAEALRRAQLAVYRADPKQFKDMVSRGLGVEGDVDLTGVRVELQRKGGNHPRLWAAFTLSGLGR